MKVALDDYFYDIEECAGELAEYITSQEADWPDPMLPGTTDCVEMELIPGNFELSGSQWICPQSQRLNNDGDFEKLYLKYDSHL